MRVANYYRVSTKLQQDRFSLAAQKTELKAYAAKQGWKLINEYVDVETGGKLDKAGLNDLLDTVESGKVDIVLCMDQDRLSRLDTVSWEYLKSVLRDNSVKIAEPTGTITDLDNEDDEFMSDLRNLMAQREKKGVVKRMMYGKRQRLREGKGWGVPPFEYEYNKNEAKYYIKKGWEWVIPLIDDLYVNENYGMTLIAQELNKISKTPTGRDWHENLVQTRLESKAFHGVQEKHFSTGEVVSADGVFEPMRTERTYNKIQEIRNKRREQFSINTRISQININLLKHVPITCGHCGRVLSVQQLGNKDAPRFYAAHGRAVEMRTGKKCNISINAKRYEYNLIKALQEILLSEELSAKYIDFDTDDEELQRLKSDTKRNKTSLDRLQESKDRLLDLYLNSEARLSKDEYVKKDREIDSRIEALTDLIDGLNRKIDAIDKNTWNYDALYEYIEMAGQIGTHLTRHEQAQIIGDIFSKAVLTESELKLTTEIYNGIPVEITVPIVEHTGTVNKWMRRDQREGTVIYH